jgi:biopolymer transport protein ExbD
MPVKLGSRLGPAQEEARIEIVPLIDILFFLLAAFMLVSLSLVNPRSVAVNLPTATTAVSDSRKDFVSITVDRMGVAYLDQVPRGPQELAQALAGLRKEGGEPRIFISGDRDARHGDVIRVLDLVRAAGIQRVAFEIREGAGTPP